MQSLSTSRYTYVSISTGSGWVLCCWVITRDLHLTETRAPEKHTFARFDHRKGGQTPLHAIAVWTFKLVLLHPRRDGVWTSQNVERGRGPLVDLIFYQSQVIEPRYPFGNLHFAPCCFNVIDNNNILLLCYSFTDQISLSLSVANRPWLVNDDALLHILNLSTFWPVATTNIFLGIFWPKVVDSCYVTGKW